MLAKPCIGVLLLVIGVALVSGQTVMRPTPTTTPYPGAANTIQTRKTTNLLSIGLSIIVTLVGASILHF